jgi:hypothetical protein
LADKELKEPLIDITTDNFLQVQAGFFIRENKDKDIGKIVFVIKCFQNDYRTEYEFKDASLGLGLPTEINPKIIK